MGTDALGRDDVIRVLKEAAVRMQAHVKPIRDLDAEIGDGDLGITVQKCFDAMENYLTGTVDERISDILKGAGAAFSEANPSTFSALFSAGLRKAGNTVRERDSLSTGDIAAMFDAAVNGIMKLGKAQAGDKTLLDALIPAAQAAAAAAEAGNLVSEVCTAAAAAAEKGVLDTVEMVSKQGRARSFGERTRGVQDPGATAVALFIKEAAGAL
jgi:dihydroxyacetone kinase-like protein